ADGDNAGEDLVETGVDAGPALEEVAFAPMLLGAGPSRDDRGHGKETHDDEGHLPVEPEHDHDRNREIENCRKDIEENLCDSADETLDAAIEPGHDGANTFAALKAKRHAMQPFDGALQEEVMNA